MEPFMKPIALSLFVIASSGVYVWDQAGNRPASDMSGTVDPAGATEDNVLQPLGQVPAPATAVTAPALPSSDIEQQGLRAEPSATRPTTVMIVDPIRDRPAAAKPALAEKRLPAVSQPQASHAPVAPTEWTSAGLIANGTATVSVATRPVAYIPIPKPKPSHRQAPARLITTSLKSSVNSAQKLAAQGFADGTFVGPVTDAYYGLIQIQALIRGGRLMALKVLRYPSDRRTSIIINRQALPMLRDEAISAQSANVDIISGATLTSRAFIQSLGGALKKASY
jgi:uncharacterized protein with FMN-binding domain